jgi:hypothetical protein
MSEQLSTIFDGLRPQVDEYTDQSFHRLRESKDFLLEYFPIVPVQDWKLIRYWINTVSPAAQVMAMDMEPPVLQRDTNLTEVLQQHCKLGGAIPWRESELVEFLDAINNQPVLQAWMRTFFFDRQNSLLNSIYDRAISLTWQLIFNLKVEYNDAITPGSLHLDFSAHGTPGAFPAPLTGGLSWDEPTTAQGVAGLLEHLRTIYDELGVYPDEIVMHRSLALHLIQQESTTALLMSNFGRFAPTDEAIQNAFAFEQRLTRLNELMTMLKFEDGAAPAIRVFSGVFYEQTKSGKAVRRSYIPTDSYAFLFRQPYTMGQDPAGRPDTMGSMIFGPTIESATQGGQATIESPEDIARNMQPGPYIYTSPNKTATGDSMAGVANFLPMPSDPRFFGGRKVIAA